ncbi:MAG: CBS domain-containing protein [Patescibacteria group bacterium]|nr:CBS domain-containing protein [Patescibacteria group bacterium]
MRLLNLLKENNIIKVSSDSNLSQALNKLSTSHDAAFVFDDNNKFLGVINPYHHLIRNSYPVNIKVKNCLFHPPKIYINYPLTKVSELFIQSKIHYLPVFDNKDNFLGIISARRILNYLKSLPLFEEKISDFIKLKKPPIVLDISSSISEAISIFKKEKISKIIIVSKDNKLKGILSYYDLINLLLSPKIRESRGDRIGIKNNNLNKPIYDYYKSFVLTVNINDYLNKIVNLILDKKIGSVVVIDKEKKPIGIITTRDLLFYYINKSKIGFFKKIASKIKLILPNKK